MSVAEAAGPMPARSLGGKVGIDATRKLPEEGYTRNGGWPEMIVSDPATAAKVDRRWKEYGL